MLLTTAFIAPRNNFPEDSSNPPYKFHLAPAEESHPFSDKKLSSSSSVAELQSSHRSSALSPSAAESQPSSWYNYHSNDTSNPHSPGLNNWQSNRSSDRLSSDGYIDGPSNGSSNPHSPGLDPWQSNGTIWEGKGSSSGIYNLKTDDDQVPQGSGSSSSSSKG
jgi:hypothetical protein